MYPSPMHYSTMRPQAPSSLVYDANEDELRSASWYWGAITRDEAKSILSGKPDGSFLVRDAMSKKGEYTLTLMKDGNEKLIKICYMNGKYGFIEKYLFSSVVEMINYYKANSLMMYNKTLDITLSYPIARSYDEEDAQPRGDLRQLSEEFIGADRLLQQQEQILDQKKTAFNAIREELEEKKLHQSVYGHAEKMFRSQITVIEGFMKATSAAVAGGSSNSAANAAVSNNTRQQEQEHLQDNLERLNLHLDEIHAKMDRLNHEIESKKEEEQLLERQINAAKPELQMLQLRKDKYIERLKGFGLKEDHLNNMLEMGFDDWQQHYEKVSNQPHHNESNWFLHDHKRRDAEELLEGAPTGTFLIRKRDAGHYALSIVCKGSIQHCIIYETESGFGFAAPYNIYPTLQKLVEHYTTNSLEEHNDTLTTTLRLPVMYWNQNQQLILAEEEQNRNQEQLAANAAMHGCSAPIPTLRMRDMSGHDVVDASLGSSETETPPASISPSNFSTSQ